MMTPGEKYRRDMSFHRLTDTIESLLHQAYFTPSEVRECAVLACIHYEQRQRPPKVSRAVEEALETLSVWRTGGR